jgi:hypothetical protein
MRETTDELARHAMSKRYSTCIRHAQGSRYRAIGIRGESSWLWRLFATTVMKFRSIHSCGLFSPRELAHFEAVIGLQKLIGVMIDQHSILGVI